MQADARFDGKWVLQTDLDMPIEDVAGNCKNLWILESLLRSAKSIAATRPNFQQRGESIRGHAFRSFLALVPLKELFNRMALRDWMGVAVGPFVRMLRQPNLQTTQ